jgi:hypothetical protein
MAMMTCPHCNHGFALTWRRYLGSPAGKHRCPACGRYSRFKLSAAYVACVLVGWVVFFGIAFGSTIMLLKGERKPHAIAMVIAIYGAGCLAIAILDKFCDERFRKLEKVS